MFCLRSRLGPHAWYTITAITSDLHGAGADADELVLVLHDCTGACSEPLALPCAPGSLARGAADVFRVALPELALLTQLGVWLRSGSAGAGKSPPRRWHLDSIEILNEKTGT